MARSLEDASSSSAPAGHVLARVESAALSSGRELTRLATQAALQAQAHSAEKNYDGKPG